MRQGDIDLADPVSPFLRQGCVLAPFCGRVYLPTQHRASEGETDSSLLFGAQGRCQKSATERSQLKSNLPTPAITATDHRETYPCKFVIQSHSDEQGVYLNFDPEATIPAAN